MPINPLTGLEEEEVVTNTGMNPSVKDYLMQKYNLGEFSDEKRKAMVDQNQPDFGEKAQAALAALGAGFMGKDAGAAGNSVLQRQKAERDDKLSQFEKGRSAKIQEFGLSRDALKADREDEKYQKEQELLNRETDPSSEESRMAQELAVSMGYKGDPSKLTAAQFKQFSPVMQKRYEIEQRNLDRQEARSARNEIRDQAVQEKIRKDSMLSDKQIEAFSSIDDATSDLNNLLGALGNKSEWTGPVDGLMPDLAIGDDQVAWRSAVGKYKDAYRHAITGAGAGPTEIAMLEKRLPSERDTLENFKAKANEAIKELSRRKQIMASNLAKGGKDVSKFSEGTSMAAPESIESAEAESAARQKRIAELRAKKRGSIARGSQ